MRSVILTLGVGLTAAAVTLLVWLVVVGVRALRRRRAAARLAKARAGARWDVVTTSVDGMTTVRVVRGAMVDGRFVEFDVVDVAVIPDDAPNWDQWLDEARFQARQRAFDLNT